MLKIMIDTSNFLADNGQCTPYSKAQHILDLMQNQMVPDVAYGDTEGDLFVAGKRVGRWKECAN